MKTQKVSETTIWKEVERLARLITEKKMDDQDIAFIRTTITSGLVKVDEARAKAAELAERKKQLAELRKRYDKLDKELARVRRFKGTEKMQERLTKDMEDVCEQIAAVKNGGEK